MNRKAIINQVKAIILQHAKPVRIWLYGSEATNEAGKVSDIDIAYLDPREETLGAYTTLSDIKESVEQLNTLVSIDVSLLNGASDRFINRVTTTGKVLFSNSKPLRAEDGVNNFEKALARLNDVIGKKSSFYEQELEDVYTDVVVKRFEFTFEMSWKAIKRVLAMVGLDDKNNPRQCFKAAFSQGYVKDENTWLDMIEMRNLSAHTYDSDEIREIVQKIEAYSAAFNDLAKALLNEIDS